MRCRGSLFLILLIVLSVVLLLSCGKGSRHSFPTSAKPGGGVSPDVQSQLDALVKPDGVTDEVWNSLKSAFLSQLSQQRSASAVPNGNANMPMVDVFDPGDGTVQISWDYKNVGDYDRNGEVGVSDITPIALHYLANTTDGQGNDTLESWIDGDASGEVGVGDITPIAINFQAALSEYEVHRSDSPTVLGPEAGSVALIPATGNEIPRYTWTDTTPPAGTSYYVVMAHNGLEEGSMSDPGANTLGTSISTDTTLPTLNIASGEKYNVINNARLHITGDANIDGELRGVNDNLYFEVDGNLTVNGKVTLDSPADPQGADPFNSIDLVLHGNTTFGADTMLSSDGSVVIVANEADIPLPADVDADTIVDDGINPVIMPLLNSAPPSITAEPYRPSLVGRSASQAGNTLTLSGTWVVPKPPRGTKSIVFAVWPAGTDVVVQDFDITGPDGQDGIDDYSGNPSATGTDGERALNMNIKVPDGDITFNGNVTLTLGSGGRGGNAVAVGNKDADATGGLGGQPGKLKIRGDGGIFITGTLTINPGRGGDGGWAEAYGADGAAGCPAEDGGNASAYGGHGATADRVLTYRGTTGIGNVQFGVQYGGDGGYALAYSGLGGDDTCVPGGVGGKGGTALADAGDGGNSFMDVTGSAGGTAVGGNGGAASVAEGYGGNGNSFADKTAGGDGGAGGAMRSYAGKGGQGTNANGLDGTPTIDPDGGYGGNGGDGCGPGVGGIGGDWEFGVGGVLQNTGKGPDGADGVSTCFFWFFPWTWILADGNVTPGVYTEDIFNDAVPPAQVGTMGVEFLEIPGAEYFTKSTPVRHVGFAGPGILSVDMGSILLNQGAPGNIVGLSFAPVQPMVGLSELYPLEIQAFDSSNNLLDTVKIIDPYATTVDSFFDVFFEIDHIDIVPPDGCFITISGLFIWDP